MSGSLAPDPPDGPGGLIVIIRADPAAAGRSLADDLGATFVLGGGAAEAALDRLLPSAEAVDLVALAAAMRRAESVRERTRASTAASLARTVNSELTIHPDTLRRTAEELRVATQSLDRAKRGWAPVGDRTGRRLRAGAIAGLAAAGIALGAMGALLAGGTVVAVSVMGAVAIRIAQQRAVAATVPLLQASKGVAQRRWEQVAGAGADPDDVEAVVHRYEPRHRIIAELVGHHPAVRAADRAAIIRRAAWVAGWRHQLGDTGGDRVPADLPESPDTATTSNGAAARSAVVASTSAPTLVVVAPYAELSEDRARLLHHRLTTLPEGSRVIVVLGPDSAADRLPVIDLTDPPLPVDIDLLEPGSADVAVPTLPAQQPVPARRSPGT